MEKKNAVTELMGSTMESIKTIMDANTIIGAPGGSAFLHSSLGVFLR